MRFLESLLDGFLCTLVLFLLFMEILWTYALSIFIVIGFLSILYYAHNQPPKPPEKTIYITREGNLECIQQGYGRGAVGSCYKIKEDK